MFTFNTNGDQFKLEGDSMKTKITLLALMLLSFFIVSNCSRDKSIIAYYRTVNESDTLVVKKPNIYIYPEQEENLIIKVLFPRGGSITVSEPLYNEGWHISVKPSGIIDNEFRYLFYECNVPHYFQTHEGWVVPRNELEMFFRDNMKEYGFNETEIDDFTEYWIPKLKEYEYYYIYPQTSDIINQLVELQFSKEPESTLRLYYLFKGVNTAEIGYMQTASISRFTRKGFTVVEWGGMILE